MKILRFFSTAEQTGQTQVRSSYSYILPHFTWTPEDAHILHIAISQQEYFSSNSRPFGQKQVLASHLL